MTDQGYGKEEIFTKAVQNIVGLKGHITTQEVIINSEADFPAPVSGVITLETNTTYVISQPQVILTNELEIPSGGNVAFTNGGPVNVLVYVGTGTMFTAINADKINIFQATLVALNGTMFDITGATSANSYFSLHESVLDAKFIGRIHNMPLFCEFCIFQNFQQGFEFQNNPAVALLSFNIFATPNTPGCVFFTFKGTINFISMSTIITLNNTNETIFDLDSALTIASGQFHGINAAGPGTVFKAGSLDQTYTPFKFTSCKNIADSTVKVQTNLENNILPTIIPAQNACVIANGGTAFIPCCEERMTGLSDGGTQYIGTEDISVVADANINFDPATATKNLESAFMVIQKDLFVVTFTNATNIVNEVGHSLSNDDTITFKNTAGTLPLELRKDIMYHVVNAATDTFQLSYTQGGAVVTFTSDGTPTNSYSLAQKVGGTGRANISAGNPIDVVPQALIDLKTDYQVYILVRNAIDAVNITVNFAFYRLRK